MAIPDYQSLMLPLHPFAADGQGHSVREARDYVAHTDPKAVLIGRTELAVVMNDRGLGVTTTTTYEVKRVDSDYFGEE